MDRADGRSAAGCRVRAQAEDGEGTGDGSRGEPASESRTGEHFVGDFRGAHSVTEVPEGGVSEEDKEFVLAHRRSLAKRAKLPGIRLRTRAQGREWRGFSRRRADGCTSHAAHGSLVVVTNLTTRQASAMRISDRGPFVPDKTIDLTIASAKAIGLYRVGTARVRIDVYETPKPMDVGGRWCVQIGAFKSEGKAERMKAALLRAYPDANVIEFPGEKSFWVRIRPHGDDRAVAERIMHRVRPSEGDAYLTRLD